MSAAALAFAALVAGFPGERPVRPWQAIFDQAFAAAPWPKNTLYLPELNIWEALKLDDPKKLDWKDHTIKLRERHLEGADFRFAKFGKADLQEAQLQGALLTGAQFQGASLYKAQLQGVLLFGAQLRGAVLSEAQFQGAMLGLTDLQGAWFTKAQLQGAILIEAQLQGAMLLEAQLQGALLDGAQLQGASLARAQLQGASLRGAELQATNLRSAFLWRSHWLDTGRRELFTQDWNWRPETFIHGETLPWSRERYEALRKMLSDSIPAGGMRDEALRRAELLKCEANSCTTPEEEEQMAALGLQIEKEAGVDDTHYQVALSESLGSIVCNGDAGAIYTLRSLLYAEAQSLDAYLGRSELLFFRSRSSAPALVDFVMSDKCPVSSALTESDKSRLRKVKREAEKNYPPPAPDLPAQKPK